MRILFLFTCIVFGSTTQSIALIKRVNPQPGAYNTKQYVPLLKNKNVALLVNQTSTIGKSHLVDSLMKLGVKVKTIFGPEHGFRGNADAGEKIGNTVDAKTGIKIISLYGKHDKPTKEDLKGIDIVLFDIQDVGVRFYTYISTLQYMMEACANNKKQLIILDRPNPNGFYIDGPILNVKYKSFVGMQPIPIVHGMTVGEYAQMLKGEKWLKVSSKLNLTVIKCNNYSHREKYRIPIPPSPNLKTQNAIYLYPSLCLFEGTNISVGRGTDHPFEMWGSPSLTEFEYSFTPRPNDGAKDPLYNNQKCYGENLIGNEYETIDKLEGKLSLEYLLRAYAQSKDKSKFFNSFFVKLAGTDQLQKQIENGVAETEIRDSWKEGLANFKKIRKKYLLYPDFESNNNE